LSRGTEGHVAVEVSALEKRFGGLHALAGVDLAVGAGEFVVVLGPTGAGKTTLLRAIAGLERPDAGSIRLFGSDAAELAPAGRDVALVFQNFSLYPSRSVRANLEFPLRAPGRGLSPAGIAERVAWAAKLLKIERLLDRPARQLSGGEMQRVAIGRAIVRRPRLFLMDEPLSNLDAKLREELRVELRELAHSLATPVLWVTHDQAEALSMADRVVVLSEGKVLQDAAPEEVYFRPSSPRVARLLGSPPMNVVEARREGGYWLSADGTRLAEAAAGAPEHATIGFRPEHVETEGGERAAPVEVVEDLGPAHVLLVRWGGERIRVLAGRELALRPGDAIQPRVGAAKLVVWT
jgi:multiple sugar transport system ATP-binding protein